MSTTVPGFISLPAPKSASSITAQTNGVFQLVFLSIPKGVPVPLIESALFDADNTRQYHFPRGANVLPARDGTVGLKLIFSTSIKDMIQPGAYRFVASWPDGSFTIPVVVPGISTAAPSTAGKLPVPARQLNSAVV